MRRGSRHEGSSIQDHGRGPFPGQHNNRAAACEAALGGWHSRLPEALAGDRQARFCMAGAKGCRVRGRLLLARLPVQVSSSDQHEILAHQDRDQQAPRQARRAIPAKRWVDCSANQGMRCTEACHAGADYDCTGSRPIGPARMYNRALGHLQFWARSGRKRNHRS